MTNPPTITWRIICLNCRGTMGAGRWLERDNRLHAVFSCACGVDVAYPFIEPDDLFPFGSMDQPDITLHGQPADVPPPLRWPPLAQ